MSSRMPIISERLLSSLVGDVFPEECDIQEATFTNDAAHQPIPVWADIAGRTELPCRKAPYKGDEIKRPDKTFATNVSIIEIAGFYDDIETINRVVLGANYYDILLIEHDGDSKLTKIIGEITQ